MKAIVATLTLLASQAAHAYFVASPSKAIDYSKPTHVLVSGRGQDLGLQPQITALGVAARIQDTNKEQIVLISVIENDKNRAMLESRGYHILKINDSKPFNTSSTMPELLKFKQMSSLQFFGHNSPSLGTQTDGPGQRFDFREGQVAKLKGHFTADGYVFIHGCNAGWLIAPQLSKTLGVPAAGAFTGTNFERLNEDTHFYVADPGRRPEASLPAKTNTQSFSQARECTEGGCLRMRPENAPYNGHWGDFGHKGLGFYKFFCETQTQAQCERVMAKALKNFLTTKQTETRNDFIESAKDFVCATSKDRVLSDECHQAMETALSGGTKVYSSFRKATAIQCDFKSCDAKLTCTDTSCSVERKATTPSTTQAEEFLAYVRGFDASQIK